jgi:polyphosphate kinase
VGPTGFHHLLVASGSLRDGLVERIHRAIDHARTGRPVRIIAKMNGLVDRRLIEKLYAANTAGVTIDLIVRDLLPAAVGSQRESRFACCRCPRAWM